MPVQVQVSPEATAAVFCSIPGNYATDHGSLFLQVRAGGLIQTLRLLAALLIIASVLAACSANGGEYLRIDDVTMALDEDNATLQINYTLDSFASLYVMALGCRHLEPDLRGLFPSYKTIKTVSADPYRAILKVEKAGGYSNGYYLFNSMPLGYQVDKFTVIYPTGLTRTFYNITSTPNVFVKSLNMSNNATAREPVL